MLVQERNLSVDLSVLRRFGGDCYDRELKTMSDGGTVGLDWFADSDEEDNWKADTPIILVMHGLTGNAAVNPRQPSRL